MVTMAATAAKNETMTKTNMIATMAIMMYNIIHRHRSMYADPSLSSSSSSQLGPDPFLLRSVPKTRPLPLPPLPLLRPPAAPVVPRPLYALSTPPVPDTGHVKGEDHYY